MAKYSKVTPLVNYNTFVALIKKVTHFKSTEGKRYQTTDVSDTIISFNRLDAKADTNWSIDLAKLYQAYIMLEDFKTVSFKPFVSRKHSPARGLLLDIGLLEKIV